jgi:hypothetical protein
MLLSISRFQPDTAGDRSVIRTETDRGIIVLIDDRFTHARYHHLFPSHWRGYQVEAPAGFPIAFSLVLSYNTGVITSFRRTLSTTMFDTSNFVPLYYQLILHIKSQIRLVGLVLRFHLTLDFDKISYFAHSNTSTPG